MTRSDRASTAGRLAPLAWVGGSFALFFLLFFDPLDIHPVDAWLQRLVGYHSMPMSEMAAPEGGDEGEVLFYRNPMDPTITSPVPAKDEMGMEYLPVYAGADGGRQQGDTAVRIDPAVVQNMNVQSEPAARRDLAREIRTVGYLEYDQERMVTVTTKYEGWVEKVYVNYVGEPVRKGQALFEIYSPELVQTQQELLSALNYARRFAGAAEDARRRAEGLVAAARTRLGYWDIAPDEIERLEETGEIIRALTVVAPADGLVMKRMPGLEGMAVMPGMETFHIASLTSLWLSVEVFEDQLSWIAVGTPGEVTFTYLPGETFRGRVRFLEPEISEKTRTLRVKLEVPNPGGRLRAGMFATVVFEPVVAASAVTVPTLAVLRTGQRSLVVVDAGGGRFEPREVKLGHEGSGYVEVLEGVAEGERVVTSAQFLIDSEASVQQAIRNMISRQAGEAPEAMDHGDMDHGAMDPGAMDHGAMDHGTMEPESGEPDGGEPEAKDHGAMDHGAMDHGAMDHGAMDHGSDGNTMSPAAMDQGSMDHDAMDHGSMDHDAMDHGDATDSDGAEDGGGGLEDAP